MLDSTNFESLREVRYQIQQIAARYKADNIRIFGSVARGATSPSSDIDMLVTYDSSASLLDHVGLIQELTDLLGRKVDVVSDKTLHPLLREQILAECRPL